VAEAFPAANPKVKLGRASLLVLDWLQVTGVTPVLGFLPTDSSSSVGSGLDPIIDGLLVDDLLRSFYDHEPQSSGIRQDLCNQPQPTLGRHVAAMRRELDDHP
jgi:hypothetical protein